VKSVKTDSCQYLILLSHPDDFSADLEGQGCIRCFSRQHISPAVLPKYHLKQGLAARVQRGGIVSGAPSPSLSSLHLANVEGRPVAIFTIALQHIGQSDHAAAYFNQSLLENPTTTAEPKPSLPA